MSFDFKGMLGGLLGGDGGGGMMNMILPMLGGKEGIEKKIMSFISSPGTQKIISEQTNRMYEDLAKKFECEKYDIGLMAAIVNVPAKDDGGQILIGEGGQPNMVDKPIIYVMIKGVAREKIDVQEFILNMVKGVQIKELPK
jgi:hypothetical protein